MHWLITIYILVNMVKKFYTVMVLLLNLKPSQKITYTASFLYEKPILHNLYSQKTICH